MKNQAKTPHPTENSESDLKKAKCTSFVHEIQLLPLNHECLNALNSNYSTVAYFEQKVGEQSGSQSSLLWSEWKNTPMPPDAALGQRAGPLTHRAVLQWPSPLCCEGTRRAAVTKRMLNITSWCLAPPDSPWLGTRPCPKQFKLKEEIGKYKLQSTRKNSFKKNESSG